MTLSAMRLGLALLFCGAFVAAGPFALAQGQRAPAVLSDDAKAMLGPWEFSNADRDKICTLTFKADPAPLGFKLEFNSDCAKLFPFIKDIAAWTLSENELLRLVDARGKPLAEFSEVENGIYEAPTPGVGVLFIQNAAAVGPAPKSTDQVAGEWSLGRMGKPICALTLTNIAAGDDFGLRIKPGCDASVMRLNFATWRVDHGELVLVSPNGISWRFGEDEGLWKRIPESADQLTMTRK